MWNLSLDISFASYCDAGCYFYLYPHFLVSETTPHPCWWCTYSHILWDGIWDVVKFKEELLWENQQQKQLNKKKSHGLSLSVMDCITCFQSFLLQGERRKNKHPTHFLDNMSVTNPYWLIHAGVLGDHRSLLGRERM